MNFSLSDPGQKIGITSTIPIEIPISVGINPLDLNNIFISYQNNNELLSIAEKDGLGHNICTWIKGIYGVVMSLNFSGVISVTGGDCSNTIALSELFRYKGKAVLDFDFPHSRQYDELRKSFEKLMRAFNTTWDDVKKTYYFLNQIREKLNLLDRLTYEKGLVSGYENHLYLVSSSDFEGDPLKFMEKLDRFLSVAQKREQRSFSIRLGYLGVPPIFSNLYQVIEDMDAMVVYNEVQRQFSIPFLYDDILKSYLAYTYPYGIEQRLVDIKAEVRRRELDGLIHYTQNFCFRQMYDVILREAIGIPVLSIEGDKPGPVDKRTLLRIESFVEMLASKKNVLL